MRTVYGRSAAGGLQAWAADSGIEYYDVGASATELDRAEPSVQSSDIRYVWEGSDRVLPL
jgi:hypothetical protein